MIWCRRSIALLAALGLLVGIGACSSDTSSSAAVSSSASSSVSSSPSASASKSASASASASSEPTDTASSQSADTSDTDSSEATSDETSSATTSSPVATNANGESLASDVLATLDVKGRAAKTGYSRDQFGTAWSDVDHNGCDTRNDILNRDLTDKTYKSGTHNCVVASGRLADPYTGSVIQFVRGQDTSSAVQIDHVVALSDAWQKGAQQLNETTRTQFANDPYNLLAVDGPANQQKSDGDAATWLPANTAFRCEYVARQIGVKAKYGLWVTQAEHDAMARVLSSCPAQTVPVDDGVSVNITQSITEDAATSSTSEPTSEPDATSQDTTSADENVTYKNCAAVRAAGKAPLYRGEPGYASKLDRDGDGIACE